jgi:transcriptional regulator with XRE-family HTH domain
MVLDDHNPESIIIALLVSIVIPIVGESDTSWYGDTVTDDESNTTDTWQNALGHTIKVRRTDVGMSRQQLADASTISYSYLSAIENGAKAPSTKILRVIADRLGLETKELLALVDARIERGSAPDGPITDDVMEIIERQEQRFRERQGERFAGRGTPNTIETRRLLLALANTLDDDDLVTLTKVAQGLTALKQNLEP